MSNPFDVNKQVASAYVLSEQIKGWFLSTAKMLLVILSGSMLFLGVVSLSWGNAPITLDVSGASHILQIIPMAIVGGLLAVCIEGGTVFASAMRREVVIKVRQETEVLERARNKYKMKDDTFYQHKKKIERQTRLPNGLMFVCSFFSVAGSEMFWQKLLEGQEWYFHVIGGVLGIVCSVLLMIFELNYDLVERVVEKCITSSGLIQTALDQSAKSKIHDRLFRIREEKLASPEFDAILEQGAEQGLLGVVSEAVRMAGMNVSAQQLQRMVKDLEISHKSAEQYIASGGSDVPQIEAPNLVTLNKKRQSKNRDKVERLYRKEGETRILANVTQYAEELRIDPRTLEKHLKDIISDNQSA